MAAGGKPHLQVLKGVNKGNRRKTRWELQNAEDGHLAGFEQGD
jgi:hypothetical protein